LVGRNGVSSLVYIDNIARIVYTVIVSIGNCVVISVDVGIVVLVGAVSRVGDGIGIRVGIGITRIGIIVAIACAGLNYRRVNDNAAACSLTIVAQNPNGFCTACRIRSVKDTAGSRRWVTAIGPNIISITAGCPEHNRIANIVEGIVCRTN
jgi:hypothetical protein